MTRRVLAIVFAVLGCVPSAGCRHRPDPSVETTRAFDPSGAVWTDLPSGTTESLRGLSPLSDEIAWVSGAKGTVCRTIDGGTTWKAIVVPGGETLDFRDIHAFDGDSAVIMSAGLPAGVFRTDDGGETWSLAYRNETPGVFFDAMAFWDVRHGLAFSDPIRGRLLVITTDDGGRSWQTVPGAALPPALPGEAGFAASGTCLAVHGRNLCWIGLGGENGSGFSRIFRSSDRGRTWTFSPAPIRSGESAGTFSLAFRDDRHGVAVGGDYQSPDDDSSNVAITSDGGRTWVVPDGPPPRGYRSVVAWTGSLWLASGTNGTDCSTDDGRSWQPVGPAGSVGSVGFHVVAAARTGRAMWAAGSGGRIARLTIQE